LEEDPDIWFKGSNSGDSEIQSLIDARVAAKKAKNWKEADRIRDELKSQGILLEDRPDGSTDWRRG
jgi:cysteinyl-tRNA synthetase